MTDSLCTQSEMDRLQEEVHQLEQEMDFAQRLQSNLVNQVQKLDEEMQLAAKMQKLFLPKKLPQIPGLDFHVLFQPAFYVSGDIYDVQKIGSHDVSFFIADAVGHGAPAAMMTMFLKHALTLSESIVGQDVVISPEKILAGVNADILERDLDTFNFATICIGSYNTQTRVLRLAHSIHPPPIIIKVNGDIQSIELQGPMLGVTDEDPFELTTLTLEVGDRLLLHSDGFELAFGNPDEPMNPDYIQELYAMKKGTATEAIIELKKRIDQQVGSLNQLDDLTVLIMDVTA